MLLLLRREADFLLQGKLHLMQFGELAAEKVGKMVSLVGPCLAHDGLFIIPQRHPLNRQVVVQVVGQFA